MKKLSLAALLLAAVWAAPGNAEIVRPALPIACVAGKSLQSFKGQPVIVLVAPSARSADFRRQAGRIQAVYQEFAARNAVFIAVFTEPDERPVPSNVPFILAADGPRTAADYRFNGKFNLYVIGRDRNLDFASAKVVPASRLMDVIYNNAGQQASQRKM